MVACGLGTMFLGIAGAVEKMLVIKQGQLTSASSLMMILSLAIGGLIGELLNLEAYFESFGHFLKHKTGNSKDLAFAKAFVDASFVVCIIELCKLSDQPYGKAKSDLVKKAVALSKVANIPAVQEKLDLINQIQHTDVIDRAGVGDLESIRLALRNLIKFIPHNQVIYETNFDDEVLGTEKHEAEYDDSVLENYREKVEFYIKQHQQDNAAIAKLKSNKPLTSDDLKSLENTLWKDLGTKDDYQKEYGDQPIGEFIRSIVGLDMNAAKEAFSAYLSETSLNSQQIYFLNQIVEYIAKNGLMKDLTVMQDSPFIDRGNIIELFGNRPDLWTGIRMTIQHINDNADVVA